MRSSLQLSSSWMVVIVLLAINTASQAHQTTPYFLGDRILIDGSINQQPVRFVFDTGASFSAMFAAAADRLHLDIESTREDIIANHPVRIGFSKPVDFVMFGQESKTRARVLLSHGPTRTQPAIDGVLSWRNVSAPILLIDGYERKVDALSDLPKQGWQRWKLETRTPQLFFVVTKHGKPFGRVFVDTGAVSGLRLAPPLWKAWRAQNSDAGITVETFRYVVGEPMVHEMGWAARYSLGDLDLYNVDIGPIPEVKDDRAVDAGGEEFIATIGIRALRQLRMIIGHQSGELLTQSVPLIPDHNRLGAVFVPEAEGKSAFVGYVLKDSPAARAGLKDGDVLLEINGIDFSKGRQVPERDPAPFLSRPAGTELNIKVERAGVAHEFLVKLQEMLP